MTPGTPSQTVASSPYVETTCRMTTGPSAKPTMPPAVKRPIPRVAFVACELAMVVPTGWRAPGPGAPQNEQDEDEPELGSNADQAQERRRHQDADASDQSQPDVFAERTEHGLRHGRGDPEHRDHQGEGRGTDRKSV